MDSSSAHGFPSITILVRDDNGFSPADLFNCFLLFSHGENQMEILSIFSGFVVFSEKTLETLVFHLQRRYLNMGI